MNRIKDRARRKAALSDRKSAAAQARMKSIANLAADDRMPKKKRKGGGGNVANLGMIILITRLAEDMFGADDADWAIYRKIVRIHPSTARKTHAQSDYRILRQHRPMKRRT